MTDIFDNAVTSIMLGIEDFRQGSDARMLSAARNYYAGLLLLGKECLIRAAPKANPMEIIGAKFEPVPDGDGGVDYQVSGHMTVDFSHIKIRFKKFGLSWPEININKLQIFRNNIEHYHLDQPIYSLKETIATSFPMIIYFLEILKEDPQNVLKGVWDTILEETNTFNMVQENCVDSLLRLNWPGEVQDLDCMSCRNCGSSLIGQTDRDNTNIEAADVKCFQCGQKYDQQQFTEMVVLASYGVDAHYAAMRGGSSPIGTCPNCNAEAYVENGEVSVCFYCKTTIAGICTRCNACITVHEYNYDYPGLCSYCAHICEKVMKE